MSSFNLSIPLSGIQAEAVQLHATADNVARRNVPNSERTVVARESDPIRGVSVTLSREALDPAARTDDPYSLDATNIDYAQEAISQIRSKASMNSILQMLNQTDNMMEQLVNLTV